MQGPVAVLFLNVVFVELALMCTGHIAAPHAGSIAGKILPGPAVEVAKDLNTLGAGGPETKQPDVRSLLRCRMRTQQMMSVKAQTGVKFGG